MTAADFPPRDQVAERCWVAVGASTPVMVPICPGGSHETGRRAVVASPRPVERVSQEAGRLPEMTWMMI